MNDNDGSWGILKNINKQKGENKMEIDKMITQNELQQLIGFSGSTLERWRRIGLGPKFVKVNNSVRYKLSDIHAFLAENGNNIKIITNNKGE
ncbi:MAG: helix-turn-helix domain-containing protein [Oryzomonas sp.]|uniref:helix-turn-helix transcriptional regulator n=1 Tax=Oryzomonas sp. TaxID=2855186 RepID=UPI00284577FF|nr:helix-turn-helix domain-containing protein [Oryzomonas sp.]MDR3581642.1 helix-turn-helix domain-containing protein [Oryzomonas sp.]